MKVAFLVLFLNIFQFLTKCSALGWDNKTVSEVFPQNITETFPKVLKGTLCLEAVTNFIGDLKIRKPEAVEIIDSWGSSPSSGLIHSLNVISYGHFDQCLASFFRTNRTELVPAKYLLTEMIYESKRFKYGVCLPSICSDLQASALMQTIAPNLQMKFIKIISHEVLPKQTNNTVDLYITLALLVLLSLTVISSILDLTWYCDKDKQFFITFSVFTNWTNLIKLRPAGTLTCLDGIRFISFLQIVFFHVFWEDLKEYDYNVASSSQGVLNNFLTNLSRGGFLAVETFLVLSGFLLTYQFMKSQENGPNFNLIRFYIKRWVRLIPACVFMQWTFLLIGSRLIGPNANNLRMMLDRYQQNPFTALFYSNPYGHLWYVAIEIRLSLVAPFLLLGLRQFGYQFFTVLSLGTISSMVFHYDSMHKGIAPTYSATGRCWAWLIGIMLGYVFYRKKEQIFKVSQCLSGIMAAGCLYALVSILYWRGGDKGRLNDAPGRFLWTFFIVWLLLLLLRGELPALAKLLSHPMLQVLSKLTYSAYLWHKAFIEINHVLQRTPPYCNFYINANEAISVTVNVFVVAVVWNLLVEMPFINLERVKWKKLFKKNEYERLSTECM